MSQYTCYQKRWVEESMQIIWCDIFFLCLFEICPKYTGYKYLMRNVCCVVLVIITFNIAPHLHYPDRNGKFHQSYTFSALSLSQSNTKTIGTWMNCLICINQNYVIFLTIFNIIAISEFIYIRSWMNQMHLNFIRKAKWTRTTSINWFMNRSKFNGKWI